MKSLCPLKGGLLCLIIVLFALPAGATTIRTARSDTTKIEGKDVTIEVVNGKVFVNGQEIDDKDNFVYKIDDGDGDEDVFYGKPHRTMRFMTSDATKFGDMDKDDDDEDVEMLDDGVKVRKFKMRMPEHNVWVDRDMDGMMDRLNDRDDNVFLFRHGDMDAMEMSPEIMKMEREAAQMSRRARHAEGKDRDKIQSDLKQKLGEIFEQKMEAQKTYLDRLRSSLDKGRNKLDERKKLRDKIIDRRLRQLMGDEDVLDW